MRVHKRFLVISLSVWRLVEAGVGHSKELSGSCSAPDLMICAKTDIPPNLDADLSEWFAVKGIESGGTIEYDTRDVSYKCLYDNTDVYFALEIPGNYRSSTTGGRLCTTFLYKGDAEDSAPSCVGADNFLVGEWVHSADDIDRQGVEGAPGTYMFELSRPLLPSSPRSAVALEEGEAYRLGISYVDSFEFEVSGWSNDGFYQAMCAGEWIDFELREGLTHAVTLTPPTPMPPNAAPVGFPVVPPPGATESSEESPGSSKVTSGVSMNELFWMIAPVVIVTSHLL